MKMTSCIKLWLKTNSSNEYDKMENYDGSNYPMWMKLPHVNETHHVDDIDQM
jgi:hypothetical protein